MFPLRFGRTCDRTLLQMIAIKILMLVLINAVQLWEAQGIGGEGEKRDNYPRAIILHPDCSYRYVLHVSPPTDLPGSKMFDDHMTALQRCGNGAVRLQ